MTIDKATESGWRPVTKQDWIDLIDGGSQPWARFRDKDEQQWNEALLIGCRVSGGFWHVDATGIGWRHCEIKTQVLRDPKFSDLENGPIECMIYPEGGHERPQKGILLGMSHKQNKRNATDMEYYIKGLSQKYDQYAGFSPRWHVKVVDTEVEAVKTKTDELPKQGEPTDDGWRTPTAEDLAYGPIPCEVRDTLDADWQKRALQRICSGSHFPYLTSGTGWKFCRIRK